MADKPIIIKLKVGKHEFEVLANKNASKDFRDGKIKNINDVLVSDNIFRNASRGDVYSKADLTAAFGDAKPADILLRIVTTGALPVSADEKNEAIETKKKEIVHYYATNFVNPLTNTPHPPGRIEAALNAVKGLAIDPKRSAPDQAIELLRKVTDTGLALRKDEMEGTVTVAKEHLEVVTKIVKAKCSSRTAPTFSKDGNGNDQVTFAVGVARGDYDEVMKALAKATAGGFTFDMPTPTAPKSAAASGGGGEGGKKKGGKKGG